MSSSPSPRSNKSTRIFEDVGSPIHTNGLGLKHAPFHLEHVYDYEPGGHHPVHLDDKIGKDERYHVIHKLGYGGFANVWLCRDLQSDEAPKYVALKILMAEFSTEDCGEMRVSRMTVLPQQSSVADTSAQHICLPIEQFNIDGPNGVHIVFVYPVLGPSVALGLCRPSNDADKDLRNISRQLVAAVSFLHKQGICHGDITPSNVLNRISGLDGLNEDQVLDILGKPILNPVLNDSNERHELPTAPQYLVYPIDWWNVDSDFISTESCLIDFGESFENSQRPESLGTPGSYRSPELILDKEVGFGSDIWALACSLFEIRTGRKIFDTFDDDDDEYLIAMVKLLGKMHEPWWSITWNDRKRFFKDEEFDDEGHLIRKPAKSAEQQAKEDEERGHKRRVHSSVAAEARSLVEKVAAGVWYMSDPPGHGLEERHRKISVVEQQIFADLLGRMFEYKVDRRITVEDILKHEWFGM